MGVARHLENLGIGAQGVVRRAAGVKTEEAIAALERPLPEMGVKLVTGGNLAKQVALTVTMVPEYVVEEMQGSPRRSIRTALQWLIRLHGNLLHAVREAGFRSIAM